MMNAYGSYTLLEAIGRKKNLKILLAHLVLYPLFSALARYVHRAAIVRLRSG